MLKGNKGEWSEIYTLFKLLSDKVLYQGDENAQKITDAFYPIIKILRSELNKDFEYSISDDLVIISGSKENLRIPIKEFQEKASVLLAAIKEKSESSFEIPIIEKFMEELNCFSLKASSSTKTDISIVVHDKRTNQQPELGFSIKSQLGNPSTLLNAGKTTNFIYEVKGVSFSDKEIEEINSISSRSKIKSRIGEIISKGGLFYFSRTEKKVFSNNLILIDSLMPQILSEVVFEFYSGTESNLKTLVNKLESQNPMGFDLQDDHKFYNYKIKRFLTDIALGMMPSKVWTGELDATGGYLVVKEDGEIVCYHIFNRNEFERYLLNNTKLETASSSRHEFGKLYREDDKLFFKLNLQIRFKK